MKKNLLYPFLVVSLSFLLVACSDQTKETTIPKKVEVTDMQDNKTIHNVPTAHWSYKGETGPGHWGELVPAFSACIQGNEQSPINIEFSQVKASEGSENIEIQYKPTPFSIVNNGHTIQANAATPSNNIVVEGKEYKLVQFHFHTPSEHQFNSQQFDMELHLVHQGTNGELAVLGLMIQEGIENENLAPVWDALPKDKNEKDISIKEPVDLQALLPSDQTSFHYNGSLTTPPCAEEVKWIVFEKPIEMSKEQIQAFQQIFPDNHRPVLPLNKREIIKN